MPRKIPKPVQQFRGTTAQHATYTGPIGELTVDTDKKVVVVQDGATAGGIPMAREDRKVAGDNYIKVNGAAKGTLAADLTLTVDMTQVAADLVSADENNGLSVGTDNKLFAKAPDADLILRPGDKILHDVDGKVAADISVSYDQPSGVLNIIGHDGTTVVATATIPSSTSALKGVELVEGKPSADGEEVEGDYHVSLRVAYKQGGAQKYSDAAGVTFTATKGTESAGVAMPEFTVPEDATDQKYEAVFMGQEAEQAVAATAAFAFTDGSTMRLAEGMLYFTPQIGIEAGTYLHFIFVLSDGTLADLYIDVTDLVDVYTAGQGITITGKEISAKLGADGGVKFDESGNIVVDFTKIVSTDADNALKKGADGKLSVTVVSADEGNLIKTGSDKGALLTKDYITDAEQARDDAKEYAKKAAASAEEAAERLAEFKNLGATAETLAAGSNATASFDSSTGVITIGVPSGKKGDKGDKGDPGTFSGDGVTVVANASGEAMAKDVAIGGNLEDLASARGQIGDNIRINTASDLNAYTKAGNWLFSDAAAGENFPNIGRGGELNCYVSTTAIFQFFTEFNNNRRYIRYGIPNSTWTNWIQFISVAQLGDGIRVTNGIISVPEYEGATASAAGTSGLVPPAAAGQQESFLTGGGEYKHITFLGPVSEKSQALGTISGDVTIDLSAGLSVSATVGGAVTLAFSNAPVGGAVVVVLRLTNGGSAVVTWPTTISWANSKAPTLTAAGTDMVVLVTDDGGATWMGSASLKYGAGV